MKHTLHYILFFIFFFGGNWIFAQNLITNPGFENISNCPSAQSQLANAIDWSKPPGSGTTPDLFHSCHPGGSPVCSNVDLPGGWAGSAIANNGDAAAGVLTKYGGCGNCREYIQTQLSSPLVAGVNYSVEYFVLCPPTCRYETNGLDCYIGNQISQPGNQPITAFTPQINSSVVTKGMGWTLISGTYTAIGGESYITLGNYRNDAGTTFNAVSATSGCALTSNGSTYLFDDVSVSEVTLLNANLLYFKVEESNEKQALIEWSISNDEDYDYLIVQRSKDGINFRSISEHIDAGLNEYLDVVPQPGVNYYRLRLKKNNDNVEMTSIKSLDFNYNIPYTYNFYPNPFDDFLQLELFNQRDPQQVKLSILDITGKLVYETTIYMDEGRQIIQLSVPPQLTKGAYYAKIDANENVQYRKLIKR